MATVVNQQQQYEEQGFCLLHELIEPELLDAVSRRCAALITDPHTLSSSACHAVDPQRYNPFGGDFVPASLQRPAQHDATFRAVAEHPRLQAAMRELLGGPIVFTTDQVGIKHGFVSEEQGGCSYFHQDSWYWKLPPGRGCNCWIPLQAVDRDAIALAIMPGSQQGWQLTEHEAYFDDPPIGRWNDGFQPERRHRIPDACIDYSREVLLPMAPGDGLFFTNYTWHRSEPNRTSETMLFYAIAYQLADEVPGGAS